MLLMEPEGVPEKAISPLFLPDPGPRLTIQSACFINCKLYAMTIRVYSRSRLLKPVVGSSRIIVLFLIQM